MIGGLSAPTTPGSSHGQGQEPDHETDPGAVDGTTSTTAVSPNDTAELTINEAAIALRAGHVTSVELLDNCLERLRATQPTLNAYLDVYEDDARQAAQACDQLMTVGHDLGPLHGIPIALKDNIALKGKITTAGSRVLADWRPEMDATVASRLKAAGALIVGKTNMHEFAWGGTSANPHYGPVRNPWNPQRFPAGSSGGSGAAVAARTAHGALGTDTGGSVRLPSAVNGITGLRPTIGRVSNAGVVPLAPTLDTVGPMARTALDCAVMMNAIAGYDPRDPTTAATVVPDYTARLDRGAAGLRIGLLRGHALHHVQSPVRAAMEAALITLENEGARIVEVDTIDVTHVVPALMTVDAAEPSAWHQRWLRERPGDYGDDVRTLLEAGELLLATHYIHAQRYRAALRAQFIDAFADVDVFLSPTLPFTATDVGQATVEIDPGLPEDMLAAILQFTCIPSLTGLPALSMPIGFDADGLPIGAQVFAKPFEEAEVLRVGAAFQAVTNHHTASPDLTSMA